MIANLIFRQGSINDLDQLQELHIASYSEFSEKLSQSGWDILKKSINDVEKLAKLISNCKVFMCEHNNTIVGMAYLVSSGNPTDVYPTEWCYIRMLGVHPHYRGNGIGKTLAIQCIESAKMAGEKTIALHTSEIMDAARHIYEGLGFTIFKEIDSIFGARYWLYTLDLSGK
jgi:ribosomal protein S18 acetylase RimI-like enzyme